MAAKLLAGWARRQLAVVAVEFWRTEALVICGDVPTAKRLVAVRYWTRTRRPEARAHRRQGSPDV
jgi:hypothetical protein